jgi:hypothetical protein
MEDGVWYLWFYLLWIAFVAGQADPGGNAPGTDFPWSAWGRIKLAGFVFELDQSGTDDNGLPGYRL